MKGLQALLALALLASASGGPISSLWNDDNAQCATKCIASQKFQYAPDTTYEFDYLAETSTSMEDASEDTARLSIGGTAMVRVISDCDMVLQLRDITVKESDPNSQSMRSAEQSAEVASMLERHPLRFSFQDGVVDELCPSIDDELWALNVKRGVLSAFQNSMSRLDSDQTVTEVDVAGRCPAEYHVQNKGWYSTTVRRSKDLLGCTDRHDYQSALQASPYNVHSSVQSLPLMKSTHECEQNIDQNGILSSATCSERHLFRPFSREASGALTKVSQTLKYRTQSRAPINVQPVSKRTSMVFQHGDQEETTRKAKQEAEEVLRQLCLDTVNDIRPDTPRIFSALISAMRRIDTSGLRSLHAQLEQNTLCANNIRTKKFFVDALPMVATEAAVTLMTQMLKNDVTTGLEADTWVMSLALISNPSLGMLQQVLPLLSHKGLKDQAMLPVSTMVNNFCQHHADCSTESPVQNIMSAFEGVIGSSCYVNKKNLDQVLLGLRSIGNAGHVSSSVSLVNKCLNRNKNPMEVRVAAAQAFRRMPCEASRDAVMSILEDSQEDTELRIASYLAVMTCPDDLTLQRLQRLMESDLDQQVGSFMWSHLTNLQETSSPHKQAIREMLKNVKLPAKFDLGRLQFSRNYEGSAFLKRLNSGAGAEGNLIWSSASSFPRSASANLTVDLFGRSFNFLDMGVRMEGLEYLVETLLGPYGYFGQSGKGKKNNVRLDELKGSMYMRMFGNEMTFQRFQGLDSFTSATSFNMLDFLIKLSKDHDISMTHSMEFLDTEMTIPTSCGLPLSLSVKGTASMDLKASGKIDLRKVSSKPRSLQIDGEIRPSGAIRIAGKMAVDAMVSRAALHVTGTLHSSTALNGRVNLDRGRVLSLEVDVPEDKMEIFDMKSEFSIVHNKVEKKQKMITDNRKSFKVCTGDMAAKVTGLELCGELQYPNASSSLSGPYFPFTGPVSLSVSLFKRDTLTSYKMLYKRVENKKKTMAQLSFNTPSSQVDRSMSFDLVLNHEDRKLEVSAATPWKRAELKGAITNTKKLMGVSGSFITDDVNTYAFTSEMKMDESKKGVTYTPVVEIRRPDSQTVTLTGMVNTEAMKSAVVDLSLTGVTSQPLVLKSTMTNTKKEKSVAGSFAIGDKQVYSAKVGSTMNIIMNDKNTKIQVDPFLSVKTPKQELVAFSGSALYNQAKIIKANMALKLLKFKPASAQITATMTERKAALRYIGRVNVKSSFITTKTDVIVNVKKGRLINSRVTTTYNIPRVVRDKMVMMAKLSDRSTKAYNKYSVRSSLDSRSFPDFNTNVKLNVDHKKKLSSGDLEIRYGNNPKDKIKRIALSGTVTRKIKNIKNVDLSYKMAAEAPQFNIDTTIKGKHSHSPSSLDSNVALVYAKGKELSASVTANDKSSKLKKMNGALTLQAPGTGLTIKSDLTQASKKQWEHNLHVKTVGGGKHSINTVYKRPGSTSREVTTTLNLDGVKPIVLSGNANLEWDDLQMAGSVKHGKELYGLSGTHKLAKAHGGKWSVEVTVPSRRVTVNAAASKNKGNYEASLETAWDADKDKSAKVAIEGVVGSKSSKGSSSHTGRISIKTPVDGYKNLMASVDLDSSSSQHHLSTMLVMGSKKNTISSSVVVATPFSPYNLDISFKAETPFRGYGSMGMTLLHKLDNGLNTKMTISLLKDQCVISLTAQNRGSGDSRDLQAQLDLKSSLRKMDLKTLSVTAAHKDDGRKFANSLDVKVNKQAYTYAMNMDHDTSSNTGDITVTWPKSQMKSTWSHRHSPSDLASTITTTWGSNQRVQIDVTGAHATGSLRGSVSVQTPWRQAVEWRAMMDTRYGAGNIVSTSSLQNEGRDVFTHSLTLTADVTKADMDFRMDTPWTETISSKFNAKYDSFPMSTNAEFSWAPRKKVTAEGSVILNNWDDLDISTRMTSPVKGLRSVAAQMTSKVEGSQVVGQFNLDLGLRKNVILTTRLERDMTGARVKLTTPWNEMRVMDSGVNVAVEYASGNVKADFKAVPMVGQYELSAVWSVDDEVDAKLRLDTPRADFPYLQILASSKDKRRVRQSRVEIEYSPRQTYSMDATYSFEMPLVVDLTVATPLLGYESMGASIRHNMRDTAMDASAHVTYANEQTVKATAMLDWSRGLDSSLTVSTPFAGWEQNSATVRHEGQWDDFNSLADVTMGGQGMSGNLKFLNKMKTDAQLSINTPFAGWEKIEASLSRKGDLTNLRGNAIVMYGDQKIEANVMNKWNSRKARLVASVTTPYTQDLKLRLEQDADLQTDASLSYGRDYSLDASGAATFNSREVSASTTIKYRLAGPRHALTASLAKMGSLQDMTLTASTGFDNQDISLNAELNTMRDIKANVGLRTPFTGFESLSASFNNAGDILSRMTSEANVQYMTGKNINGNMELTFQNLGQMSIRATVTTPFSGMERSSVSLSHSMGPKMYSGSFSMDTTIAHFGTLDASYQKTGHWNRMKGESRINYNSKSLLDANMTHRLSSGTLQSSIRVLTPLMPEINMDVDHQGSMARFGTTASASFGANKASSETQWSMNRDNLDLSQKISSNLNGQANQAAIVFSRIGPLSDVTVQLSGNINAQKAKIIGKLATYPDFSAALEVESPFDGYRQMGASVRKTGELGELSDLTVIAATNLERQQIEVTGKFNNQDNVKGSVDITTPFTGFNEMGASFNYNSASMTAAANLQRERIEGTVTYDFTDGITSSLTVTTPFTGFTQMGGQFRFAGDVSDLTLTTAGNIERKKVEMTAKFNNIRDISGSVDINTPFTGFNQMGSSFAMTGDFTDLTVTAETFLQRRKAEVKAVFQNKEKMSGSITVQTPFSGYRQMGASFQKKGDFTDLTLQGAANLMNDKMEASAKFNSKDGISGTINMATTFEGFRQVGASFQHSGPADNFNTEGQVTYMDGQVISGKLNFYNYQFSRIDTSAELRTPFSNWKMTKVTYKHSGSPENFECNAKLQCSLGTHAANLKVNLENDHNIQLTVKTPYEDFRTTELIHSLSMDETSAQWIGTVNYGKGQRANSQLTVSYPQGQISSTFDLQTPFTSDFAATYDYNGVPTSFTQKTTLKYGDILQFAQDVEFQINGNPLFLLNEVQSYTFNGNGRTQSLYLRREGPWNDLTLAAKGALNGESVAMDANFKNQYGRIEGDVKVNTPFEGFTDIGASFQHVGELSSAFNSEAKVEYSDGQEVVGKLDFTRSTWRRLEVTAQLATPFEDWTQTTAEYRHKADNEGFTCYAGLEYLDDQRLTGDLRVTSSPNPEVTVTVKTPFSNWEQMSATGAYQNDGWGKQEVSSKVDLGNGFVYSINSALIGSEDEGKSINGRLTTPHADWHTLEARVSHKGGLQDFQSSAYLSTPLMDAVSAAASLRFTTPFDLTGAASLDTPFKNFQNWKMEIVNGERGSQKTSHVIVGWSGDQEIVMDGTWRHDNGWYERLVQADVSISSPFETVREASWNFEHHATQDKYGQKMTGSLNGDKLIDLDLATHNGDLPEVTVTLREPYPMLYSLSRTSDGAELNLDWDRNDPNSNLRLTSRFVDSSDSSNTQHDLDLKVIHPSRTVGAKYNLQAGPQKATSQGEVYWGRGGNRKVSYLVDLTDLSRRSTTSYEGKVKVGLMSRALQLSGAVSQGPMSRQMDGAFNWDADRDENKQVAVKTKWTSGDRNKADITLSLPAINQEVRVQSEVAVNQGNTLLDATTALSYSQDSSKVLTLTSRLEDTTGSWDTGSNYTLKLTLTHPHTDLDVSMTSHLGASDSRYSAAVDTWYLTSRRQRKNMALRGEIDQLRRQITMEMVSPINKMSMKGEVKSMDPYSVRLTNRYDDDQAIQADVTIDSNKRSFSLKTNYDLEHPERSMVLKAFYVNDTAIRAELYRDHVTDVITDALVALRLNTSTLLHSRLHWRPASVGDLQQFAVGKLSDYAVRSKQTVQTINQAVREELAARYSRSAQAVAEDLSPLMDLISREMGEVADQLLSLRRQLHRFYRRHPQLQDMGSAVTDRYQAMQTYLGQVSDRYHQHVEDIRQSMQSALQAMTQFPIGQHYQEAVDHLLHSFEEIVDSGVAHLTETVESLDNYLLAARENGIYLSNKISETARNISSHPRIASFRQTFDFTPYVEAAANKVTTWRLPQQYTDAVYTASNRVNDALSDVMNTEAMKQFKQTSNDIYQEGLWAYKYWNTEENLKKHLQSIVILLKEIIQEELEIYTRHFRFLKESHMTVWDPEHGEIQAEVHLPVTMETLDSMPDMTPIVNQYNEIVEVLPDRDSIQQFYDNYTPSTSWWSSNNSSDQEQLVSELNDFTPSSRRERMLRRKSQRRFKVVAA